MIGEQIRAETKVEETQQKTEALMLSNLELPM